MSNLQILDIEPRLPLLSCDDIPGDVLLKGFGYLIKRIEDGDVCPHEPRLVRYRGAHYDIHDAQTILVSCEGLRPPGWAMLVEPGDPFAAWHGIVHDSAFSGVLFRIGQDDTVTVGRYTC